MHSPLASEWCRMLPSIYGTMLMTHPKKGLWLEESNPGTALRGRLPAAQRNANSGICASKKIGTLAKNSTPAHLCNGRQKHCGCTHNSLSTALLSVSYVLQETTVWCQQGNLLQSVLWRFFRWVLICCCFVFFFKFVGHKKVFVNMFNIRAWIK